MESTRVLLVFPGSLYGGEWAAGPRLKPDLVTLYTEVRRAGYEAAVVDLEAELGRPGDDGARRWFAAAAERLLAGRGADLVVISCRTALQYTASVAVAEIVRKSQPGAAIAVCGYHVAARPGDFTYEGAPFDWLIVGEPEGAVLTVAAAVAGGDRGPASCRLLEGTPLPLDAEHVPDVDGYPYFTPSTTRVDLLLSRGCPYTAPACLSRPGGAGWHAYPPEVALRLLDEVAALGVADIAVADPAFGYDSAWRAAVLSGLAAADRHGALITVAARPADLTRHDVDGFYRARLRLRLDVGTLSPTLLSRTGQASRPLAAAEHALDLMRYLNAKGLVTVATLFFNQPGETPATAAETLDTLEAFVDEVPNASLSLEARSWPFIPAGDPAADLEAPAALYGMRVVEPEWWKKPLPARQAAEAVTPSRELEAFPPGSDSYWRPRFEELRKRLDAKLVARARRGERAHEDVGSEAEGVPHGWLA